MGVDAVQPGRRAIGDDMVTRDDLGERRHPEIDRVLEVSGCEDAAHDRADGSRASIATEVELRTPEPREIGAGERFIGPGIHGSTVPRPRPTAESWKGR